VGFLDAVQQGKAVAASSLTARTARMGGFGVEEQ
jgi:hypothetical protein